MTIGNLQDGLTRDLVTMYRVIPDNIRGGMEDRLLPTLQEQKRLEPGKADELRAEHLDFIRHQQNRIDTMLTVLFGKMTVVVPVQSTNSQPTPASHPAKLDLEKLKPPVFDGNHTKWLLFKAKFKDIVIDGAGYSDTQQGHVLRNLIPKEAQERVDHLKLGSEMINILDELYGDAATSVSILVNKLLHLRLTRVTMTMTRCWKCAPP